MCEVVGAVDEDGGVAGAEGDARKERQDPVHGRSAGPGEPELADGHEDGGDANNADHGFGGNAACFWIYLVRIDHAPDEGFADNDEEAADGEAGEGETAKTEGPAADAGEDDGVGDEAEVEDAVDDGDVEVPENADGFCGDHDEGTGEVDFH